MKEPAIHRNLPIKVSARTMLVTLEAVRIARGCNAETVLALVDDAKLRWVFDFAIGDTARRELRFWTREIIAPETCVNLSIPQVINSILGGKKYFHSGEIEQQWVFSAQTIMRLRRSGEFLGGKGSLTRASLAAFLERRLQ
jgi:hypothetical protein